MIQWASILLNKRLKILVQGKHIQDAKVLVMGAAFKEDVSDIRNSKIVDIVSELKSFQVKVDLIDPHADSSEMEMNMVLRLTLRLRMTMMQLS